MGNWGSGSQNNIPRKSLASEDRSYLDACMKEQKTPNLPYEMLQKSNGGRRKAASNSHRKRQVSSQVSPFTCCISASWDGCDSSIVLVHFFT